MTSKIGFYSVASRRGLSDMVLIRARARADLEAWATIAGALAGAVDYPNFKAAVHGEPAQDKAYLRCWMIWWRRAAS